MTLFSETEEMKITYILIIGIYIRILELELSILKPHGCRYCGSCNSVRVYSVSVTQTDRKSGFFCFKML